jgi:hypothetical protein
MKAIDDATRDLVCSSLVIIVSRPKQTDSTEKQKRLDLAVRYEKAVEPRRLHERRPQRNQESCRLLQ